MTVIPPQTADDVRKAYPQADKTISRISTRPGESVADAWRRQDKEARGWDGYWHIVPDGENAAYIATAWLVLSAGRAHWRQVTAPDFRHRITALGYTQRGFAAYVGANERTVRRWAEGEQDIPQWVGVMLDLMEASQSREAR